MSTSPPRKSVCNCVLEWNVPQGTEWKRQEEAHQVQRSVFHHVHLHSNSSFRSITSHIHPHSTTHNRRGEPQDKIDGTVCAFLLYMVSEDEFGTILSGHACREIVGVPIDSSMKSYPFSVTTPVPGTSTATIGYYRVSCMLIALIVIALVHVNVSTSTRPLTCYIIPNLSHFNNNMHLHSIEAGPIHYVFFFVCVWQRDRFILLARRLIQFTQVKRGFPQSDVPMPKSRMDGLAWSGTSIVLYHIYSILFDRTSFPCLVFGIIATVQYSYTTYYSSLTFSKLIHSFIHSFSLS